MKKSLLTILALIIAMLVLVACDGNSGAGNTDTTYNTTEYVNGVQATAPVEKGNYVVYVRPSDDSRWFAWDYENWSIKDADTSLEYSVYFFKVDALFDSVEALEAADSVTAGTLVGTKSYHAGLGRGAAIYEIIEKKPTEAGILEIDSLSLYARVYPFTVNDEKIITVDQFGTYGDGERADHGKINIAFKYADANVIEFESSVYMQENTITLNHGNVRIDGNGAEIHNSYPKSVVNRDFQIAGSSFDDRIENIILENLTVKCTESRGQGTLYNERDHFQLDSNYTKNLTIKNCKFLVPEHVPESSDIHVTSVSLHNGINTIFENNTVINLSKSTAYSGGVWFWSDYNNFNHVSENLVVRNNYIEKSSHDEVLAFFHGAFNNITVENNEILTYDEPNDHASAHAIGFGVFDVPTTVKNVTFSNNSVDIVCNRDIFIFSDVENIKIFDNELIARNNTSSEPIMYGVFRVAFDEKNYDSAGISPSQKNVEIYNNTVKVYNPTEVPMNYNCNEGFDFHDNTFEYIPS